MRRQLQEWFVNDNICNDGGGFDPSNYPCYVSKLLRTCDCLDRATCMLSDHFSSESISYYLRLFSEDVRKSLNENNLLCTVVEGCVLVHELVSYETIWNCLVFVLHKNAHNSLQPFS